MTTQTSLFACLGGLILASCASGPRDFSLDEYDNETLTVPVEEAVPAGWSAGELEAFAERRRALFASLESLPAEKRAQYKDIMALREGSLEPALAAEAKARLEAFIAEQEEAGWRLVSRDERALHFARR